MRGKLPVEQVDGTDEHVRGQVVPHFETSQHVGRAVSRTRCHLAILQQSHTHIQY